ncbi:MauE/DoxX family redox-associated membrane protein [uncultured Chitinophaga sp.]|uniref:MauE/DoxX family redox-associated membrane protein n=1 Tax=uncultured Chitinophaga sp. TaxID=339340 RepID=UPI00345BF83B
MNKKFVQIIGYAFILLFVYTALSKWFTYNIYLYDLRRSPDLGRFALPISLLVPGLELLAAGLLLFDKTLRKGLWFSFVLMLIFTAYVAYVLIYASDLPCTCGGIIRQLSWPQHLIFNIFFTMLAAVGLHLTKKEPSNENNQFRSFARQ